MIQGFVPALQRTMYPPPWLANAIASPAWALCSSDPANPCVGKIFPRFGNNEVLLLSHVASFLPAFRDSYSRNLSRRSGFSGPRRLDNKRMYSVGLAEAPQGLREACSLVSRYCLSFLIIGNQNFIRLLSTPVKTTERLTQELQDAADSENSDKPLVKRNSHLPCLLFEASKILTNSP